MFYIILDNVSSLSKNVVVSHRPSIPAPEPDYTDIVVDGVDGSYTEFKGTYRNIIVPIEFHYITNPNNWHQIWRDIKSWLLKGGIRKLIFSDDTNYYRVVKKITLDTNEREFAQTGKFKALFTFSPYEYLCLGESEMTLEQALFNPYDTCEPTYIIKGEGNCTLTINGNEMSANVSDNLVINTHLKLAYKDDGTLRNTYVKGNYTDLLLFGGFNAISITEGFDLKVIPNWRCL